MDRDHSRNMCIGLVGAPPVCETHHRLCHKQVVERLAKRQCMRNRNGGKPSEAVRTNDFKKTVAHQRPHAEYPQGTPDSCDLHVACVPLQQVANCAGMVRLYFTTPQS
eukprot:NODE_12543_length_446_cov_0.774295_g12520_i0.p1 GENE.NODE_12543_length_446_cov_0.774295_g12520_i0~~NODE_12543_length_446_cov_0.774295_g12520_i0.p1  ORF type:complete len:108 (+),score=0.82 NODE_12543_length_446_cov_0.774295_g12520_i0:121-444(+)